MSGGGDQESSTTFSLAPEQRDILDIAMPFLKDVQRNPPTPPTGTAIAPFNPTQEAAQAGALATAPLLGEYAANAWDGNQFLSGGDVLGSTPFTTQFNKVAEGQDRNPLVGIFEWMQDKGGAQGAQDFLSGAQNPAFDAAVDAATRPIVESTMQQVLPGVRQDFIGAGQYGGTKQGLAEGNAINTMQRNIGDVSSGMASDLYSTNLDALLKGMGLYSDAWGDTTRNTIAAGETQAGAYGNELDAMLKGLGLAPQTASLGLLPWQVTSAVGDTQHGMEMAQQQEAYNQEELANMWSMMLGQELAGTVGLIPGGTNTSSQPAPQMNPFSMALGGLGLVSGLGPLMGLF